MTGAGSRLPDKFINPSSVIITVIPLSTRSLLFLFISYSFHSSFHSPLLIFTYIYLLPTQPTTLSLLLPTESMSSLYLFTSIRLLTLIHYN